MYIKTYLMKHLARLAESFTITVGGSPMTQEERVLDYLATNPTITGVQALNELGIFRLASRVSNLKKQGHKITSKMVPIINRYGEKCYVSEYRMRVSDDS